jgi:CBS domain-containing protein
MSKKVRDLMHRGLITCRPETTLGQVAVLLARHHIHALVVTDRDARVLGVITDFDLLAGEWLSGDPKSLETMRAMTAGELMTAPVDTIEAEQPARNAAERMRTEAINRLMVIDQGKPVGVISISDFVASLVEVGVLGRDRVTDVMSRAMLVCREDTPIAAVARGMTDAGYRSVLVVDFAGRPQGVVSGQDLLAFCREEGCGEVTAREAMHQALTIHPQATVQEAAKKMIEHHHHRLIVVDPDRPQGVPMGIVSSFDIVNMMAQPGSVWLK